MVSNSSKVAASLRTTRPLFVTCWLINVACGKVQGNLQLLLRNKVARQKLPRVCWPLAVRVGIFGFLWDNNSIDDQLQNYRELWRLTCLRSTQRCYNVLLGVFRRTFWRPKRYSNTLFRERCLRDSNSNSDEPTLRIYNISETRRKQWIRKVKRRG